MQAQTRTTDGELLRDVRNFLDGQHFRAAQRMTIEVIDGIVTLRGQVKSFYTRQVFVHGCRRLPGVAAVVDDLRVET